jgi:histidine triad (HIT) family protein
MNDCIFCRIVEGTIPSQKVDETAGVLAFRDTKPAAPTHVLLIPKQHVVASAADLGPAHGTLLGELFALASRIAKREGLENGWRLVTNVGHDAGQSVLHLHVHLLGGRALGWPPG